MGVGVLFAWPGKVSGEEKTLNVKGDKEGWIITF